MEEEEEQIIYLPNGGHIWIEDIPVWVLKK